MPSSYRQRREGGALKNHVRQRREVVGQHDFLEHAPEHEPEALFEHVAGDAPRLAELRQQMRRPLDRAGDQLGEEGDEGQEMNDSSAWRELSAVDVDGIAHRLEGVERDAHRQDDVQRAQLERHVQIRQQVRQRLDEEIVVLEEAEDGQVARHARDEQRLAPARRRDALQPQADPVIEQAREREQPEEPPVPPAVEKVAGRDDEEVAGRQASDGRASKAARTRRKTGGIRPS